MCGEPACLAPSKWGNLWGLVTSTCMLENMILEYRALNRKQRSVPDQTTLTNFPLLFLETWPNYAITSYYPFPHSEGLVKPASIHEIWAFFKTVVWEGGGTKQNRTAFSFQKFSFHFIELQQWRLGGFESLLPSWFYMQSGMKLQWGESPKAFNLPTIVLLCFSLLSGHYLKNKYPTTHSPPRMFRSSTD